MSVNTDGGAYVGGNVNPERDFIGRDQIIIQTENHFYTNGATPQHPPLPLPSILDPDPVQQSWIGVARAAELAELNSWYEAVVADKRGAQPRLAIITGAKGSGKRDLLRYWRATLLAQPNKPIVAATSYLPRSIQRAEQENYYSAHPGWNEAWVRYTNLLRGRYRHTEMLGGLAWVALAAQLVQQSANVAALLQQSEPLVDDSDHPTIRHRMSDLLLAALADGPLVLVLEAVDQAQFTVLEPLLQVWRMVVHDLPCLLLLVVDTPFALHSEQTETQSNDWFTWLREQTAPHAHKAHYLHVGPLRVDGVAALLTEDSQAFAPALHYATGGAPAVVQTLLHHAQQQGQAIQTTDGRWQLQASAFTLSAGKLYQELIVEPLQACATHAQELGYTVTWETLLHWLNHAAWEGETFTDEALAHAVGMHGEKLEDFQVLLDEVLVRHDDDPDAPGLLVELAETVALPTGNLDYPEHHLALYRFEPPLLAGLLYNRQHDNERIGYGSRYLDALVKAYQPFTVWIAPTLVDICRALGREKDADRFLSLIAPPSEIAQTEATLAAMRAFAAVEPAGQVQLVRYVLDLIRNEHGRSHPRSLLLLLTETLNYADQPKLLPNKAELLLHTGWCYRNLGEMQEALVYYGQALSLYKQVGDHAGEATTLNNIGVVYTSLGDTKQAFAYLRQALSLRRRINDQISEAVTLNNIGAVYEYLSDKQQALVYFHQALSLYRQAGDKSSEVHTLSNIGHVYADLNDNQQALDYLQPALLLCRHIGDKAGEAYTLTNIGHVYAGLGDNQQALTYFRQALPLFQQIGDKDGEAAVLNNIGLIYNELNDSQQALAYFCQTLLQYRQIGKKTGEADTLNSIGRIYADLNDNQQALAYFQQALLLLQQVGDHWHETIIRTNTAKVYQTVGDLDAAEAQLREAVALGEALNHPDLAKYRQALVELQALRRQGVIDEAGQSLQIFL